ncbi:VWA domain-containing protein [Nakamurella silvestris]|nr:VWA domain-containing protein [Nakamurella silvestris]
MTAARPAVEILLGFTRVVAAAGLPVNTPRCAAFLEAADALDVADPRQTYWAGRLTLCAGPADLFRYDTAFLAYFGESFTGLGHGPGGPRSAGAAAHPLRGDTGHPTPGEDEPTPVPGATSDLELLRDRDFQDLDQAEQVALQRLFDRMRPSPPVRRVPRRRPADRGRPDPRRTVAAMMRSGGEPVRLHRRERRLRPRRIVALVDISGSMAPYADSLLKFARMLQRRFPGSVETFTMGTRLTRVTGALAHPVAQTALVAAAAAIPDWSGGTRLGETLGAFVGRHGRRGVARGAVVVIFSDGWERGSADRLATELAALHLLARTVIWVNPHQGKVGYLPVQSGMVAALPHVDHFLAGHSYRTLEELLVVMERA